MLLVALLIAASQPDVPRTLRFDYVHSGNAREERFAQDGLALEGPWPGRLDRAIDDTNLGKYFFEVVDRATNRVLFSRGFASIYGEWETTGEAGERDRAFHESLRFPEPTGDVQVVIKKRAARNVFREVFQAVVDPKDPSIDRAASPKAVRAWAVLENGPPQDKVDVLLLGDGYTAAEMDKWHADARKMVDLLFAQSPFKERKGDFNVWAIDVSADEKGVSRPSDGVYRRSPVGAAYDSFGSERYVLTMDNRRFREIAAAAPYEFVEIVVNDRKYGGGGIFNLYATAPADSRWIPYLFVHEFGHHFAGLADEYYTSAVAYEKKEGRPEPWEPNATADPKAGKWAELVSRGAELPTRWDKERFEALQKDFQARRVKIRAEHRPEDEMDALFREELETMTALLGKSTNAGVVGAFEGANYEATGYYRPQADCIMFTRDEVGFCAVCRRAIGRVIDLYSAPSKR
ncbi:MAG TPA: IgA Peptidase M64 [Vicinamibacteria bacterium]|nr:IgA Peptidase M64 [Vicinamibacteria bacterium]